MTVRRAADLAHPLPIAAIALLAVNDHVFKHASWFPRTIAGKLSDVCGLFFFPMLLVAIAEALRVARRRSVLVGSALVTSAAFAAIKLSPALADPLGITPDASDLWALPAAAASVLWMQRDMTPVAWLDRAWVRAAIVLFAAGASLATSAPRLVRPYPVWRVADAPDLRVGCAKLHPWISKSGKEGVGVTVRATSTTEQACPMQITSAEFEVAGRAYPVIELPSDLVAMNPPAYAYLGFAFDNEDVWISGVREASLSMMIKAGGGESSWRVRLTYISDVPLRLNPPPPVMPIAVSEAGVSISDGGAE